MARHFDSFDFSTLCTNMPHDLLLHSISQLIREVYGDKYLVIKSDGGAYWLNVASTRVTKEGLVEQIKFLVDSIYIHVDF